MEKIKINKNMTKEQAVLYYLFVDEQLLCAWWDYLEYWDECKYTKDDLRDDPVFVKKMNDTMEAVEYWENILDQLKEIINFEDIENHIASNPQIKKNYLFVR